MSADSIVPGGGFNPQLINRYSYVKNNPLMYTDPSGHCLGHPNEPQGYLGDDIESDDEALEQSYGHTTSSMRENGWNMFLSSEADTAAFFGDKNSWNNLETWDFDPELNSNMKFDFLKYSHTSFGGSMFGEDYFVKVYSEDQGLLAGEMMDIGVSPTLVGWAIRISYVPINQTKTQSGYGYSLDAGLGRFLGASHNPVTGEVSINLGMGLALPSISKQIDSVFPGF